MSQASKQVQWCLTKAQKEIAECMKASKRPKHRGLVEGKTNQKEAEKHLDKARHNLEATLHLQKSKFGDMAMSSIFYSMYHCFMAISLKFGYDSRNQTCTIALVESLIEEGKIKLDMKFVEMLKYNEQKTSVIDLREEYTYSTSISVKDEGRLDELISNCKDLVFKTNKIVFGK